MKETIDIPRPSRADDRGQRLKQRFQFRRVNEITGSFVLVVVAVLTQLGTDLGETRQHLDQLTVRLQNMAAGVEAGKGTVGRLITDATLADEAQKLLARANEAMSELQGTVTNLNVAVKNVEKGTARLPEITDAVANETKDLPGLVQQTQTSMRELERLIEAMQRHWLLRKYVNKTNPPPARPPSEPAVPEQKPVNVLRSPGDSTRQTMNEELEPRERASGSCFERQTHDD